MNIHQHITYFKFTLYFLVLSSLIVSCSSTKHLPDGKYLLRKNKITVETDRTLADKGELKEQLESLAVQKPNTYLFGIFPYKIWLYNLRYNKYKTDSENYQLQSKTVEAPVVLDSSAIEKSITNMKTHLNNSGYFHPIVEDSVSFNDRKATVHYHAITGKRLLIDQVIYDTPDSIITTIFKDNHFRTLFKNNTYYSNTLAGEERERLTLLLKDKGFYHFNSDNIRFELDTIRSKQVTSDNLAGSIVDLLLNTTRSTNSLDIYTIVENNKDSNAFSLSRFGNIYVFTDFKDTLTNTNYGENNIIDSIRFIDIGQHYVNHNVIRKKITIRPYDLYSLSQYDRTLRFLNDLNIFQYVRIRYREVEDSSGNSFLNTYIFLAPAPKRDFNTNVEVSGGDIYVFGTAANVSIINKNFLKGANRFATTVSYGIELDRNNNSQSPYFKQFYLFSQNFGLNFSLTIPKILFPIDENLFNTYSSPKTVINFGTNALYRSNFFFLQNINANINYQWHENQYKTWNVKPVFVNMLRLSRVSPSFQARMDSIPAIKNAYEQTFIEGEGVDFIYNNQGNRLDRYNYIRLGFEESGLLMKGIDLAIPYQLKYAQYTRLDFDARQYFLTRFGNLIFAFRGGIGIPYDKSKTLPYVKQYFVGGAYSIRGWRPRVLGPGSYYDSTIMSDRKNLFIDQAGDIKLELNAEYRFTLVRLFANAISLNGAVFTDAGNIWLAKKDAMLPNAEFNFGRLYQDFALSSGVGLRLDLGGFLVVRLDYAMPLKKPYVFENHGWVLNKINFKDKNWRQENLNFSFAIGYPF